MFFTSLVTSAGTLPHLRRLILKGILKTGWRDRANFRDRWIRRLERVFLRRSTPPNPHMCSFSSFAAHQAYLADLTRNTQLASSDSSLSSSQEGDSPPHLQSRRRTAVISISDS